MKCLDYFKIISIPGIPQIVKTESYPLKLLWTVAIFVIFAFGFHNISLAITDYYKYDKITNIERATLENVTFPAMTICVHSRYLKAHYLYGSNVNKEQIRNDNVPKISNFLDINSIILDFKKLPPHFNVIDHMDSFKTPDCRKDCIRFNGATNKSIEFIKVTSVEDSFHIVIKNNYMEPISAYESFNYGFDFPYLFYVYISDNHLKSFEKLEPLVLGMNKSYIIKIEKESAEIKLPQPYNQCKESSLQPYHQSNCISSCIFKEIKKKYNCTFSFSLFALKGLEQCDNHFDYTNELEKEFSPGCLKECPLESCFSEKFTYDYITEMDTKSETIFEFSFRDLSTLNITQIPKVDGFTFLNNIGGGLGLFMGIAFPNLIEFLQFIFEICSIIFYN